MNMRNQVANLSEIQDLIVRGAIFYVGHSGGKDSQAMFAALSKIVPASQLRVIHADLGRVEWEGAKEHIRQTIGSTPLRIAQAIHADGSPKDFFSMVRARRESLDAKGRRDAPAFPSSAARFCTSDLKTGPIWKIIREEGARLVVNCVGIRGEESASRAKRIASRGTLQVNKKNSNSRREAFDYWPIADWTVDQVWSEIASVGQEPHPVYKNNERMSCVFCVFGSRSDLRNGARQRPELLQALVELERDVRSTMFADGSLADRVGNLGGIPVTVAA